MSAHSRREIAETMGMDVKECTKKWKSVIYFFYLQKRKRKQHKFTDRNKEQKNSQHFIYTNTN